MAASPQQHALGQVGRRHRHHRAGRARGRRIQPDGWIAQLQNARIENAGTSSLKIRRSPLISRTTNMVSTSVLRKAGLAERAEIG